MVARILNKESKRYKIMLFLFEQQIKKNLKKNDQSKESIQHQSNKFHKFELTTYNLKPKEPNDQPVFPTIVQFKKNVTFHDYFLL